MKTQFVIEDTLILKNGKIVISGLAVGRPLVAGDRGCVSTELGELEIETVFVGLIDPTPADPNAQMLQIKLLQGEPGWLRGVTVNFE